MLYCIVLCFVVKFCIILSYILLCCVVIVYSLLYYVRLCWCCIVCLKNCLKREEGSTVRLAYNLYKHEVLGRYNIQMLLPERLKTFQDVTVPTYRVQQV